MTSTATPGPTDDRLSSSGSPSTTYRRFVAIGDSWTEGVGDPHPDRPGSWRGWADRVAETLATRTDDFAYANLAIRGRTVREILDEQLDPALALEPDLLSIQGGGNDLLHLRVDIDELVQGLDEATARAIGAGAQVVLFTHGAAASGPFSALRGRIAVFNELIREVVDERGAVLVDNWRIRDARDPRYWDVDRVHLSPLGHQRAAAHALETLGIAGAPAPLPPSEAPPRTGRDRVHADLAWARTFLGPWLYRRATGRSLGDGVSAKRPHLGPV